MNVNPLKEIWDAGGAAVGSYIMYSRDVATVEIAAAAGLDFLVFDLEHRTHGLESIHDLCQVARLAGVAPLVGPAAINAHDISVVLDIGASGVIIPHVDTIEEVQVAIDAVRYPPRGHRGRAGVAGHNLYAAGGTTVEEMEHYNSDVALLIKVETEAAIGRLEELVAPEDVNGVMVGPLDLSIDMGIPGETTHPRLLELIDRVREVCGKARVHYGDYVSSPADIPGAIEAGASWVIAGSEMDLLSAGWKSAAQGKDG